MVAAIDATYAMGFVEALFKSFGTAMPRKRLALAFAKLAMKGQRHWFRHADIDLGNVKKIKIYESVRARINSDFRFVLHDLEARRNASSAMLAFIVHSRMSRSAVWTFG